MASVPHSQRQIVTRKFGLDDSTAWSLPIMSAWSLILCHLSFPHQTHIEIHWFLHPTSCLIYSDSYIGDFSIYCDAPPKTLDTPFLDLWCRAFNSFGLKCSPTRAMPQCYLDIQHLLISLNYSSQLYCLNINSSSFQLSLLLTAIKLTLWLKP